MKRPSVRIFAVLLVFAVTFSAFWARGDDEKEKKDKVEPTKVALSEKEFARLKVLLGELDKSSYSAVIQTGKEKLTLGSADLRSLKKKAVYVNSEAKEGKGKFLKDLKRIIEHIIIKEIKSDEAKRRWPKLNPSSLKEASDSSKRPPASRGEVIAAWRSLSHLGIGSL